MGNNFHFEDGFLYLQIETTGFIGIYGGSTPFNEALRAVRSICGFGLALRLFEIKNEFSLQRPPPLKVYVHELIDEKWKPPASLDLSESLSAAVRSLRLHTVNGWVTEARQASWANTQLDAMKIAFTAGEKPESLQLAAQWFFDGSRSGQDLLLQYVQTMIVLEILLGDKKVSDEIGLNELLRNRCAYLICRNEEERQEVLSLFSKIYKVRSEIVHSGKHRLSMEESFLFDRLKLMCRRVIAKELELLAANKKT